MIRGYFITPYFDIYIYKYMTLAGRLYWQAFSLWFCLLGFLVEELRMLVDLPTFFLGVLLVDHVRTMCVCLCAFSST